MKLSMTLVLLFISTLVSAKEITPKEFYDLNMKYIEEVNKVEVGMTAEYRNNQFLEDEYKTECQVHEKEVVISVDFENKYLVYNKTTNLNDCGNSVKGAVMEQLQWRNLRKGVLNKFKESNFESLRNLDVNGLIVSYETVYTDNSISKTQFDVSKSQFYSTVTEDHGIFKRQLLKRSFTDINTINLDYIDITDMYFHEQEQE